MNDRELLELELAAKSAGLVIGFSKTSPEQGRPYVWNDEKKKGRWWNPIENDGDALRLAVKLRLSIDHNHSADQQRWVAADRNGCEGCYAPVSCVEDDFDDESQRSSATRRAIVRAAAEIQLQKEREQ